MKKIVSVLFLVLLVSGCNGYKKKGLFDGYSDMQITSDSFMVGYTSYAGVDRATNFKYALRRAAEITKEHGYQYFQIANLTDASTQHTTPIVATTNFNANSFNTGSYGYGRFNGFGQAYGNSSTIISGGNTYTHHAVEFVITMLESKTKDSYDAGIILNNFKDK